MLRKGLAGALLCTVRICHKFACFEEIRIRNDLKIRIGIRIYNNEVYRKEMYRMKYQMFLAITQTFVAAQGQNQFDNSLCTLTLTKAF